MRTINLNCDRTLGKLRNSIVPRVALLLCAATMLTICAASAEPDTNAVSITASNAVPKSAVESDEAETELTADSDANLESAPGEMEGTNAVAQPLNIIAAIPPSPPAGVTLTKAVEEVIKLAQSDLSEAVIVLFVEKSTETFDLSAADILYLRDIGISAEVLTAMLNHDGATSPETEALVESGNDTTGPDLTNAIAAAQQSIAPGQPPVEVSSNYVATAAPQEPIPTVTGDPNAVVGVVQQPVIIQQQPAVVYTSPAVSYSYFYSSLSPYGTWIDVPDYGWCWQPSIAVSYQGWRPYLHGGRWLYSTSGWYWQSDYSWGWAPFHYGRWFCAPRRGWVWVPDYTWGPSWVTWRRGADYCGWAPLPPRTHFRPGIGFSYFGHNVGFNFSFGLSSDHYCFVPTRHFVDRHLTSHVIATGRGRNIYNHTTVVNNYVVGNNNTIINNGVGRDYVERHTRTEVRQVKIENAPNTPGRHVPSDRIDRQNGSLVVYRPTPPSRELAQRHESVVRAATSRNAVTPPPGTIIRPSASSRPSSIASNSRAPERQGASTPSSSPRSETARANIRPSNQLPVWSKPEPVRVRPQVQASTVTPRSQIGSELRAGTPVPSSGLQSPKTQLPSRPGVVTSPRGAAERQANGLYQRPSVPSRTTPPIHNRQVPSITPRTTIPAPAARQPSVTPAPNVRQPARTPERSIRQPSSTPTPAPSVRQPSITPAPSATPSPRPSFSQPRITPSPSVRVPSVNRSAPSPTPSVRQPAATPSPSVRPSPGRQPSVSPAPAPSSRQPVRTPQRGRQESSTRSSQNLAGQNIQARSYTPVRVASPAPQTVTSTRGLTPSVTRVAPAAPRTQSQAVRVQSPAPRVRSAPPQIQLSPRAQSQSPSRPQARTFSAPQVSRAPVAVAPGRSSSPASSVRAPARSITVPQRSSRPSTPAPRVSIQSSPARGRSYSAPASAPAGRSIRSTSPTRGRRGER